MRQGYAAARPYKVEPHHLPVWTGPLQTTKHRFEKEIAALREDAWLSYLMDHADIAAADIGVHELARATFMAGFNISTGETAARMLAVIEYIDGLEPEGSDCGGLSAECTLALCDEFGLEPRKGRHK